MLMDIDKKKMRMEWDAEVAIQMLKNIKQFGEGNTDNHVSFPAFDK